MKIKIGGSEYKLVIEEEFEQDICGAIDPEVGEIQIKNCELSQYKQQTFWHEVVHGMLDEMGSLTLSGNEEFVEGFSRQLYGFYKNNNIEKIYSALGE